MLARLRSAPRRVLALTQRPVARWVPVLALAPLWSPAPAPAAVDWPRFRGPNGAGVATGARLPEPPLEVSWRTPVPEGRSSPVVWGDRVLLTAADGDALLVLAFDASDGSLIWRAAFERARRGQYHEHNGPASPTLAVDEHTIAAFFPDLGLVALDHAGRERWRRACGPYDSKMGYGLASSPILADNAVVLVLDQHGHSQVMALDAEDGTLRWQLDRPSTGESWTTPVLRVASEGAPELLHLAGFALEALDLRTGADVRWILGAYHEPIGGLALDGDHAYFCAYGPPRDARVDDAPVRGVDADGDGRLSLAEIPAHAAAPDRVATLFRWSDADGDGTLDDAEAAHLQGAFAHYIMAAGGTRSIVAVDVARGRGDTTARAYLWSQRTHGVPEISAPVVVGDRVVCIADEGGIVTVLAKADGRILSQRRVDELAGWCFASPVAAGARVLFVTHEGNVVLVDVQEGIQVLGELGLGQLVYATPAVGDGAVWVRGARELFRLGR